MQTENEARKANAQEWAQSLRQDEIERLLLEGRNCGPALSQIERAALVQEEQRRKSRRTYKVYLMGGEPYTESQWKKILAGQMQILTHAVWDDTHLPACSRVQVRHLHHDSSTINTEPLTCQTCQRAVKNAAQSSA